MNCVPSFPRLLCASAQLVAVDKALEQYASALENNVRLFLQARDNAGSCRSLARSLACLWLRKLNLRRVASRPPPRTQVDAWVVVKVGDPEWVFNWRLQAEVEMRAAGKPGLTDEQVKDFVSRFMPAYKAYLPVRGENENAPLAPLAAWMLRRSEIS